ncbi:MAG: nitroreductase family protein [Elusimicrobiota bacterium]
MPRHESTSTAASMSVLEAICERRSVRSYSPQAVGRGDIQSLLDAAVLAPTAVHEEPWRFVVIQDREMLRRLSDSALTELKKGVRDVHLPARGARHFEPPENVFYNAGTLIAIYGEPLGHFVAADCWLAAENLMLAARAMGLGTCVIGLAVSALNLPEWKKELGVPADLTAYAPIIVGVPAGETPATGRKEPNVLCWKTGLMG